MKLVIKSLSELPEAAGAIAGVLRERGGVVALYGAMGAGKTTLVAELVRAMGSLDSVSSPTFALVNEYLTGTGRSVFHFDFYRIDSPREAFDIGYEEYFYGGELCLVEWAEKIEELLPPDTLRLYIDVQADGSRTIEIG